jgi:hypothetical protein
MWRFVSLVGLQGLDELDAKLAVHSKQVISTIQEARNAIVDKVDAVWAFSERI